MQNDNDFTFNKPYLILISFFMTFDSIKEALFVNNIQLYLLLLLYKNTHDVCDTICLMA